jgi:anti-sigma-K factor RskA
VAESAEDIDLLIEQYLDGQMEGAARAAFEARMRSDPGLRSRVNEQTRSMDMIKDALGALTPDDEFDTRVNSKIISITQSRMRPAAPSSDRPLSSRDPDARLLGDPDAEREKKRLIAVAVGVLIVFLLAATVVGYAISKRNRAAPPPEKSAPEADAGK